MPKYIEITEDEAWAIDHTIRHTYAEGANVIGKDCLKLRAPGTIKFYGDVQPKNGSEVFTFCVAGKRDEQQTP